ncbi:MAG TPA: hypothetical protein VJ904_07090 [Tichowtungia sp.]|nr:hypothetical protein [Tichowtungia sp.]
MKTTKPKQGFVLTAVMMLIVIASLVGGAFLISARRTNTVLERWNEHDRCMLAVQAGLEAVNYSLYTNLLNDIYVNGNRRDALGTLDGLSYSDLQITVEDGFAEPPDLNISGGMAVHREPEAEQYAARGGSPFLTLAFHPALGGLNGRAALRTLLAGNPLALLTGGGSGSSGSPVTVHVNVQTLKYNNDAASNSSDVFLECEAKATYGKSTRAIREKVLYDYNGVKTFNGSRNVFDYAFFIDNHGYFSGVNCDFNGDVKANKDVDLKYSSIRLQGDAFAGGECTSHKLYKSYDWNKYGDQSFAGIFFGDRVRPMLHTDGNRSNDDSYYEQGYAEGVRFFESQERDDLPFIGPLSDYEEYAISMGGSAGDASTTVNAVWGDDAGEDAGNTNAIDDGCLVLIGTEADPINLDGVVVAQKDIYIGGYYTGQGTLYAGRNVYVIDNLVATDPPSWSHPDNNAQATADANKTKDFMGLCAKGNLIFGDYQNLDRTYLKEPHTASHATDVSDAALGYVSYTEDGEPFFDGDYTERDGLDGNEVRTDGSNRHYYEPILSDADYAALNPREWIGWFDAVLYANHLIAGDFDSNAVINGAFVCRDESVKRHGNLAVNWDARLGSRSLDGQTFYAGLPGMMLPPRQPMPSRTIQWAEIDPDDV